MQKVDTQFLMRLTLVVLFIITGGSLLTGCGKEETDPDDNTPEISQIGEKLIHASPESNISCVIVGGSKRHLGCWGEFLQPIAFLPPEPTETFGIPDNISSARSANPFILQDANGDVEGITDVAIRQNKICAIKEGTKLLCWGWMALDSESNSEISLGAEITVPGLVEINKVALSGSNGQCVAGKTAPGLPRADRIVCWGHSSNLRSLSGYAIGPNPANVYYLDDVVTAFPDGVEMPHSNGILSLESGRIHYCAILKTTDSETQGDAVCWGDNDWRQLGNNSTAEIGLNITPRDAGFINFGDRKVQQIAPGDDITCALLEEPVDIFSSGVRCWGRATEGAMGYSREEIELFELEPWGNRLVFNAAHTLQSISEPVPYDVTLGREFDDFNEQSLRVRSLAVGARHVCVIIRPYDDNFDDLKQAVRCWGDNNTGLMIDGASLIGGKFRHEEYPIIPDPNHILENSGSLIHNLGDIVTLGENEEFFDIAIGRNHNCVLVVPDPNNEIFNIAPPFDNEVGVKCWGRGREGQMANGTLDSHFQIPYEYSFTFRSPE